MQGPYEHFITEALTIHLEGKVARFSAMVTEAQDTAARQSLALLTTLDLACEGLVRKVTGGELPAAPVVPALQEAFDQVPGCPGLDHAFCRLLSTQDEAGLARILQVPDAKRRTACLDILGAREEDALVPFFLRAMQDSIVEVGQRAMHHFGKLPSGFPTVMGMFQSGQLEQVRTALRIFTENGTEAAAEPP